MPRHTAPPGRIFTGWPMGSDPRVPGELSQYFLTRTVDSFADSGLHQDEEAHILWGQQGGSVEGVIERSAVAAGGNTQKAQARKEQDRRAAQVVKDIIEQVHASIANMDADIKHMEAQFDAQNEAWREELALEILDKDIIPQRQQGESMSVYRERLEVLLIAEMLNADGSIKDEYKNHPEYGDYAEWAQKNYHLNRARSFVAELEDENTSPERREEIFNELTQRSDSEERTYAARASTHAETRGSVKAADDAHRDNIGDRVLSAELPDFLTRKA